MNAKEKTADDEKMMPKERKAFGEIVRCDEKVYFYKQAKTVRTNDRNLEKGK